MRLDGDVYRTLLKEAELDRPYDRESRECVEATVSKLLGKETTEDRPGMLLGMIQSGKTKTFLGVVALGVDNGFQLFIVFTKGTKALTSQTFRRLKKTFRTSIEQEHLQVFDIMSLPKLTRFEQRLPMIIVVKKEKRNLERLQRALFQDYPQLATRKALIIDDEADFASLGFKRSRSEAVELQTVMRMINEVRSGLENPSFLQVTATPYSLYLQPKDIPANHGEEFKPIRPAFTELVPIHDAYIGGEFYFDKSQEAGSVASYLYEQVAPEELDILHHSDRRSFKIEEALTSHRITGLRNAITNFIVGGLIRRMQSKHAGETPKRYSFIIHTETSRGAHTWQEEVIEAVVDQLREASEAKTDHFKQLVREAYDRLSVSVQANNDWLPPYNDVYQEVEDYLPAIQVEKVNSENQIANLLDEDGQLELRNRLNIFIGGLVLDRGLTIGNLIGFYYGRRTNRFQQDTVLQHARMYGARPMADLTVTRFYTSTDLYQAMRTINEFDAGLRQAFRVGGHDAGVIFIRQEDTRIVPCSPNKILVSTLTTLRAGKRLLPVGFQTGYKSNIGKVLAELDKHIDDLVDPHAPDLPVLIDLEDAKKIVKLIEKTYEKAEDSAYEWDVKAFVASMEYISLKNPNPNEAGKVIILTRRDRDSVRVRDSGRFFDAPDTSQREGVIARQVGTTAPVLILLRQKGEKQKGWRDCPFWWPVLYMPERMGTVVFASDTYDFDTDNSSLIED